MLWFMFVQMSMLESFAGDNGDGVCNPYSPIVVEQSSVKLFSFQAPDERADRELMDAASRLMGEPVLRIANITDSAFTVTIDLQGDGFLVDLSQLATPKENVATWTVGLPAGSTIVVPLVYQPTAEVGDVVEGPSGEQVISGTGTAVVGVESEGYEDFFSETYLVGIAVILPEDALDMPDELEDGTSTE